MSVFTDKDFWQIWMDEASWEETMMDYELPEEMNFKRNPKHHESQAALFSYSWPSSTVSSIKQMEMCHSD